MLYQLHHAAIRGLRSVGRERDVPVDGGCPGMRNVVEGNIGATSMQFLRLMASTGVDAIKACADTPHRAAVVLRRQTAFHHRGRVGRVRRRWTRARSRGKGKGVFRLPARSARGRDETGDQTLALPPALSIVENMSSCDPSAAGSVASGGFWGC